MRISRFSTMIASVMSAAMLLVSGCTEMEAPSDVTDRLEDLENRVTELEIACREMNANVSSLQVIVSAMQKGDYITSVTPIYENGVEVGFTVSFANSGTITIYHGKDGEQGPAGPQGESGSGSMPEIGIRQDTDGVWYWTLDGEWLLDDGGNRVKAVGVDGVDGASGKDGATPQLKIEDGYWMVSYDNGETWTQLCKAVGENGADGATGMPGTPGADGVTPQLKIEAGKWYVSYDQGVTWEELGQATGADGAAGESGKDGITPQLKIEDDYWYISYDNGSTWTMLGKAKGEDGDSSASGDSIFKSVTQDESNVYFTLSDGSVITVQKIAGSGLNIEFSVEQGVAIVPNTSLAIEYTITGGDANTLVRVINTDYWVNALVKPLTSSTGKIYIYLEGPYYDEDYDDEYDDEDGKDDLYYEEVYGDVTNEESYYSNLVLLVSVSDADGNQLTKALNITEGKISSVSDAYIAGADSETISVTVNTNVEYTVEVPESAAAWLSYVPTKASMRTDYLTFSVNENTGDKFRSALVELKNNMNQTMEYFTIVQRSLNAAQIVEFADPKVKAVCVAKFDKDQDGELSYEEIATVTDIEGLFEEQKTIESFDEFEYFTSVSEIPASFFADCKRLTSVKLPDSVRKIGYKAFSGCVSLKSVVIPEGVTNEDDYYEYYSGSWFVGCSALESVTLPSTLKYLPDSGFTGCTSLVEITIPEGISEIPQSCFSGCSSLAEVNYSTPITCIGEYAFCDCTSIVEFDLSTLVKMGGYAFAASGIVSVTIPESMDAVPACAFAGCESLETVELHAGVSEIEYNAFGYVSDYYNEEYKSCVNLKSIDLTNVKSLGEGAFFGSGLTEVTIPKAVTKIPESAFCACASLATVNLHDAVTSIGRDAFGSYSFYDYETGGYITSSCSSLKNIDFPESLLVIYEDAFSNSSIEGELIEGTEIVALDIPASVSNICSNAFSGCMNLTAVKMNTSDVPDGSYMFPNTTVIYVPSDAVEIYKASSWGNYTILSYDMLSVSLGFSVTVGAEVAYSAGYFYAPLSVTVTGDKLNLTNVVEYGYYVKITDRWGDSSINYYPVDTLNVATETTLSMYPEYAYYENYKAVLSVNMGAYVKVDEETVITYSNTPVEVVYDKKPSVKFTDVTTSVDGSVNFELTYEVEGAYWIYNKQLNKEGNGYFSMSSVYIEDGVNTTSGSWNVYETPADGYIYFSYYDRNDVDYTSNFVHLSMDADSVVSAEIVDSME